VVADLFRLVSMFPFYMDARGQSFVKTSDGRRFGGAQTIIAAFNFRFARTQKHLVSSEGC
jgi:hypothetical protein